MENISRIAVFAFGLIGLAACAPNTTEREGLPDLQSVSQVDIQRYMGTWYEIASYPQRFQAGCTGTTASYSLRDDGQVDVLNRCYLGGLQGELKEADGLAKVRDSRSNAKLAVSFFRPFWGDYWIIELGDDYEYAVVGHPGRDYLWILSRSPQMATDLYERILNRLSEVHRYDLSRIEKTVQAL